MTDNQIVFSIVNDVSSITNNDFNYIIKKDGMYFLSSRENGQVELQRKSSIPIYIYVLSDNKTIILYDGMIYKSNLWFICSDCMKVTSDKLKIHVGIDEICVHCYFKRMYNMPKETYDGVHLTIAEYIKKFERAHRVEKCDHKNTCFLCDYKSGKLLHDVKNVELLYGNKIIDIMSKNKIDIVL